MATNDYVRNAKRRDGIFDRSRNAAVLLSERGHDIARVADDEQFARAGLHDLFWHHARVGTGDNQNLWRLPLVRELAVKISLVGEDFAFETEHPANYVVHVTHVCHLHPMTRTRQIRR